MPTTSHIIQMEVESIKVEVVKKNIRHIYLRIYPPDGKVKISAPTKTSNKEIRSYLSEKINWIKKKQLQFTDSEISHEKEYLSGESHYLWGQVYTLNVIRAAGPKRAELRGQYIDLYAAENSSPEERQKILNAWYARQLENELPVLLEKWQKITGIKINSFKVMNRKSAWGTCAIAARRISLNLNLAKKPPRFLEYIVVHEIMHILHRNHDKTFQALMDVFLPSWRALDKELNYGC